MRRIKFLQSSAASNYFGKSTKVLAIRKLHCYSSASLLQNKVLNRIAAVEVVKKKQVEQKDVLKKLRNMLDEF